MAQHEASGSGPAVDPYEGLLLELASDARSVVAEAKARFDAAMAKSDALDDSDVTKAAGIVRDKAKAEETRLNGARARLAQASADLSAISVTRFGAARQTGAGNSVKPRLDPGEARSKLLKRKLSAPKDGWKDAKGVTLNVFTDRHTLYQHVSNIFWQLRVQLREEASLAPDQSNAPERAKGVKRVNLPNPDDYTRRSSRRCQSARPWSSKHR